MPSTITVVHSLKICLWKFDWFSLVLWQHINERNVLNAVRIEKDVDGFHPLNIGRLAMRGRDPLFVPCTPKGCIELLHRYGISIKGKRAVVIGRSNIVGMPAALLLQVNISLLQTLKGLVNSSKPVLLEYEHLLISFCFKRVHLDSLLYMSLMLLEGRCNCHCCPFQN